MSGESEKIYVQKREKETDRQADRNSHTLGPSLGRTLHYVTSTTFSYKQATKANSHSREGEVESTS